MAPIDPDFYNSHLFGISALSAYALVITASLGLIGRTLSRAYGSLPIAKRTRASAPERRHDVLISAGLAALSFVMNIYHVIDAGVTSYSAWSIVSDRALPINIWTSPAWFPSYDKPSELQIGRWLTTTDWLQEVAFALGGRSRDYWWAQQLSAATLIWSIFVAIEGRRRNIPHLWSFILLAHLVGLSTAQNLFNLTLLLTPLPLIRRKRSSSRRQNTWTPHPVLHIASFFVAMLCTALFPYMRDNRALFITSATPALLTFAPLVLTNSKLMPASWGKTHSSIHTAHASSKPIFATNSRLALTLHLIMSTFSLFLSIPPSRQSSYDYIWSKYTRTPLTTSNRLRIALTKLLGSISDNPLVRKVGWDVVLSGLTLCVWTALRGLDSTDVLTAAGVPGVQAAKAVVLDAKSAALDASAAAKEAALNATSSAKELASTTADTVSSTAKDLAATAKGYTDAALASSTAQDLTATTKEYTSTAKSYTTAALSSLGLDNDLVSSSARAISERATSPVKRKPGRPRKTPANEAARSAVTMPATKHINVDDDDEDEDEDDDEDYAPSRSATTQDEIEHEEEHGPVDIGEEAESAALTWGMLVLGGLGFAGAGVWGAEVVGR